MSKKHDSYESIRDERRYGPYWYSALWRIIRPILIGLGAVLVVAGILFSVWNKVYGEFIAPPDENSTAQVPFTIESGHVKFFLNAIFLPFGQEASLAPKSSVNSDFSFSSTSR